MRLFGTLLVVFGATFVVFFWLLKKPEKDRGPEFEGPRTGAALKREGERGRSTSDGEKETAAGGAAAKTGLGGEGFPTEARKDLGVVEVGFDVEEGFRIDSVDAKLTPHAGVALRRDAQGVLFIDVAPGVYGVAIDIPGAVPQAASQVAVEAGRVSKVRFPIAGGVPFGGVVIEGKTLTPIPGATVRAGNHSFVTDGAGAFRTPAGVLISPKFLDTIVVTHPEYDRLETRPVGLQDTREVTLALQRGDCRLAGRFILPPGVSTPPAAALVKLIRRFEAREQLRRELHLRDAMDFELVGVVADDYELVVEFPGTEWPRFYASVPLSIEPFQLVEIPYGSGARLHGTVVHAGRPRGGEIIEIVDTRGRVYAEATTAPSGVFRAGPLVPGDYRFRFKNRVPVTATEPFTIPNELSITVDVDFETGKVRARK